MKGTFPMAQKTITITIKDAQEAGTRDGRAGFPPPEYDGSLGNVSDFEKQLAAVASRQVDELVKEWQDRTNAILIQIKSIVPSLLIAIQELDRSLKQHAARFGGDARPEAKHKSTKMILLGLAILLLIEGAVNANAFRTLRETNLITYILGFGLSILVPVSGFLFGRLIKSRDQTLFETLLASGFFVVAVGLVWIVAQGREDAIMVRGLAPEAVRDAFWTFLLMNALLFLIAIWHGWYTGYKYPELQKRFDEFQRKKRGYRDRWGQLNEVVIRCLGDVRQLADEVEARRVDYQQANRHARTDVQHHASLPAYFTNGTKLVIDYPKEINILLQADDPTDKYHELMLNNPHHKQLKDAEEAIDKVDEMIEGKNP